MSPKTGANAQAGPPQRRLDLRGFPSRGKAIACSAGRAVRLCAASVLLAAFGSAFGAESPMLLLEAASPAPVLAYTSLSTAPAMASLWLSASPTTTESLLDWRAQERQSSSSLLRWQTEPSDLKFRDSLLVGQPKIDSRLSYLAWAAVHTGVGEYFLSDTFPRLRSNGVGVQNPRWFFVKMSFKL